MSIRLPRLTSTTPITDDANMPSGVFQRYFQTFAESIENALTKIGEVLGITDDLQKAIDAAQKAADTAQKAADMASEAASTADDAAKAAAKEQALVNSYITPDSVLTYSNGIIHIAAHTRIYGDGTSVPISAGTLNASFSGDTDYVFYDDPARQGGTVTYQEDTAQPAQGNGVHVVGAIIVPSSGSASGGKGPQRPGHVDPLQ